MQQENTFKQFFIRNSYILVAAAWFITISFIIDNYWSGNSSITAVKKNMTSYVNSNEINFDAISNNRELVNKIVTNQYSENFLQGLINKQYFLFVYKKGDEQSNQLFFWNTQVTEPSASILTDTLKSGFVQLSNGYYVWRKADLNGYLLVALIPIKYNYSIPNEYLQNSFAIGKDLENEYDISLKETSNVVKSIDGNSLFYLSQKHFNVIEHNNIIAVILRLLAAALVLLFIQLIAYFLVQKNFYRGVLFLIVAVTSLRIASYFFPIPLNFRQFDLFDPSIYGANIVFRSLGDLLINSLLFLWVIIFTRYYVQEKNIVIHFRIKVLKWIFVIAGFVLLILSTLVAGHIVPSMIADSQISFDVVNFFTLNIYSVLGFLVLGIVAIGYFFSSQLILYLVRPLLPRSRMVTLILVAFTGLAILTTRIGNPDIAFEMPLLVWLLLYVFLSNTRNFKIDAIDIISSKIIFWLFFFSVSITTIIFIENGKKEMANRRDYAEALSAKADPSSERLMNTVLTDFRSELLAPLFGEFKNESTNKGLKDSLLNENFMGYLNNYDTRIYTFDESGNPLFNQDSTTFNTFATIIKSQGKQTAIPDLYYYDISYDRFSYISKKDITDSGGRVLGSIIIIATPKKYKTDALYPELFLKGYNNSIENSPVYSYAVYNNLQLVNSHNDYPFSLQLSVKQVPANDFEDFHKKGYDELWYNAGPDKVVIIAKEDNFFIESITLFSYLFSAFLFVTVICWLLSLLARSRLKWVTVRTYLQMSIRSQIHGIIIFISLLSFVVIGVATILFFINRYHNNNREKLSQTIQVLKNEIRNSVNEMNLSTSSLSGIFENGYRRQMEQTITRISEVNAIDVNLYDINGNLQISSLPLPYSRGIVSNKMDPLAYYHLNHLKQIQFLKEETIGTLKYLSNYVPVLDKNGNAFAYLNIPYFASQTKLRQEISNFLVAIINLNAFIFLIAGVVALVITNRITRSFSLISSKMKQVNLGGTNEAIKWNRNDEIGELVKEYNKMVAKLDERAAALAKSEREGAWREMARQVAHEIKNPLTPMKLSLQYLQRAINDDSADVKALSASVAKTLVEQIDHLSQIAGEFSQFANIGNPRNEIFDLNESLRQLTQLHAIEDNLRLDWKPEPMPVWINADRTHINRLFTNLIQNAIQAVPQYITPHIEVEEQVSQQKVLITVKDNGTGIDDELQSSIFTPNFTTKTSGTGLGLAMCKSIVEQNKGRIWFDTKKGTGTTFFVELPLTVEK